MSHACVNYVADGDGAGLGDNVPIRTRDDGITALQCRQGTERIEFASCQSHARVGVLKPLAQQRCDCGLRQVQSSACG